MFSKRASLVAAAMLAAGGVALAEAQPRVIVPPTPKTQERLTKAEKKRARKAAQRLKLAQGKSGAEK